MIGHKFKVVVATAALFAGLLSYTGAADAQNAMGAGGGGIRMGGGGPHLGAGGYGGGGMRMGGGGGGMHMGGGGFGASGMRMGGGLPLGGIHHGHFHHGGFGGGWRGGMLPAAGWGGYGVRHFGRHHAYRPFYHRRAYWPWYAGAGLIGAGYGYGRPYYRSGGYYGYNRCYRMRRVWTDRGWRRRWVNVCRYNWGWGGGWGPGYGWGGGWGW